MATMEGAIVKKGGARVNNGQSAAFSNEGALRVGDCIGKYTQVVEEGNVYIGTNLGGTPVTTQAGLSVTTPALSLFNPANSGYNLYVLAVSWAFTTAAAAACAVWLAATNNLGSGVYTVPTTTTLATVYNAQLGLSNAGNAAPVGQCYRVATLIAAPLTLLQLGGATGAAAISAVNPWIDLGGLVCVSPGMLVCFQTSSAVAFEGGFIWHERPIP